MTGLQLAQKLEPQTARLWLASHERVRALRGTLVNIRFSARTKPGLAAKMQGLILAIAAAEAEEQVAVMAIAQIENQHRRYKNEKRLRKIYGTPSPQNKKPERLAKPAISNLALFFICLGMQPQRVLSN